MQKVIGIGVLGKIGGHRAYDTQIIHALGNLREKLADRYSTLTIFLERPWAGQGIAVVIELGGLHFHLERLAMFFLEARFGIESIHLGRPAVHVEKDNIAGFGGVMGRARRHGAKCWRLSAKGFFS